MCCAPVGRIPPDAVAQFAVRGQYAAGWNQGERASGYRDEPGIAPDSNRETYAALTPADR